MRTILLMTVLLVAGDTAKSTYACHWTEHAGGAREVAGMVEGDVVATSPVDAVSQTQKGCEARKVNCSAIACSLKR